METQVKAEYKLDKEMWRSLIMATGSDALWPPVDKYVSYLIQQLHKRLEYCDVSEVPNLQGQIQAYKAIRELRNKAIKETTYIKEHK